MVAYRDNKLANRPRKALLLPEIVYQELRNAILDGVFVPGSALRQEDVALQLGVSRSPLREALPRLETEGLVTLSPRRGYTVATMNREDIQEAFDLRVVIEKELAERSISNRTKKDSDRVFDILSQMSEMTELEPDSFDYSLWFAQNHNFHKATFSASHNPHFMRAWRSTRGIIEAYIRAEVRLTGDIYQAQREHTDIYEAFAAGEKKDFMFLVENHARNTLKRLLQGISSEHSNQD